MPKCAATVMQRCKKARWVIQTTSLCRNPGFFPPLTFSHTHNHVNTHAAHHKERHVQSSGQPGDSTFPAIPEYYLNTHTRHINLHQHQLCHCSFLGGYLFRGRLKITHVHTVRYRTAAPLARGAVQLQLSLQHTHTHTQL